MNRVPKTKSITHQELTDYMYYESGDFQTILKIDSFNKTLSFYERIPGELVEDLKPLHWTPACFDEYVKVIDAVIPGVYTFDVVVYNGQQLHIVDLLSVNGLDIEMFTYTDRLAKIASLFVSKPPMQITFKSLPTSSNKLEMYNGPCDCLIVKELVSLKYNMDYKYVTPPKVYKIVGCADLIQRQYTTDVARWRSVANELELEPGSDPTKISASCKSVLIKTAKANEVLRNILTKVTVKQVHLVADAKNLIFGYCILDDSVLKHAPTVKESNGYTWMMADHDEKFANIKYFKTPSVASFNHKTSGKMEMYKLQMHRLICDDSEHVVVSNLPVRMRIVAARLSKSNLSSLITMLIEKLHLVHFNDNIEEFTHYIKMLEDLLDKMDHQGGGGSIMSTTLPKKRSHSSEEKDKNSTASKKADVEEADHAEEEEAESEPADKRSKK
ncbi:hypothetical protein Hz2V016 [Helicoverpa zea nudivirus 2]|uniref:Uncharacterized protein n=1 Tax=Helicoverpa zea nudivirus 2 TaxID=1128424 RepID=G9I042_HZNV2|nr:orf16 gene product [Helicoverpa zea nudivirus 2]AEW69565.1 hypothetical protein Hz2V016 [Helicoverpa zea nudivirus 2]